MAWLLWLMLLAFLACSIRLAAAEPDNTSSTNHDDESDLGDEPAKDDEDDPGEDPREDPEDHHDDELVHRAEREELAAIEDVDGVATDGLDDAQADDPAPASVTGAWMAPAWAHGVDHREAALRSHTSWLGRLDVSLTWRRALNESTAVQRDEVWLVGTWRL